MRNSKIYLVKYLQVIIFSIFIIPVFAQKYGGMWIPTELNEKEMKEMGMKISAKNIFNAKEPSIKDAVVHFGGGCTAEIISDKGLLLTNHHCGYGNIQRHSSVENDLLKNGFWAKNMKEELPNPGLTVTFVVDIKDVTADILRDADQLSGNELDSKIKNNINTFLQKLSLENYQNAYIKSFYHGNKYYLFINETYKDVRLVGAPPESIGKFGADTDNWVWPRHTGDFSLFRVYANKNNKPAEYSIENVPYKPKYYLPISTKGIKEDDFVFVFGFPGATDEYLPASALNQVQHFENPARINMRDVTLKIMGEEMRKNEATRIQYASKFASIANYWKKWIGENQGLEKSNAIKERQQYEKTLINKNASIANVINSFDALYERQNPYTKTKAYYDELMRNAEILRLSNQFNNFIFLKKSGAFNSEEKSKLLSVLNGIYANYDPGLDVHITASLLNLAADSATIKFFPEGTFSALAKKNNLEILRRWYMQSIITGLKRFNGETVNSNIQKLFYDEDQLSKELQKDSLIMFTQLLTSNYNANVYKDYKDLQQSIDELQKEYMTLQLNTDKEKKFFPDANSTLRVTYGKVKGSRPEDAVEYLPQTYLKGVMEKYVPGDYEFDVPQKLIELYNKRDFGSYKDATGDVPLAFTSTSHTTGGNSGSPAIDANGNLVGLNFDRQWEGTMSDLNYDPEICRNIMVDVRYILFIIDKFADADWLLKELKLIK